MGGSLQTAFPNGVVVSRMYGNNTSGELIAIFSYTYDAVEWAKKKAVEDKIKDPNCCTWYIVANTYSGEVLQFTGTEKG